MPTTLPDMAVVWALRVAYAALILAAGLWFAFFVSGLVRKQALKNPHIDTTIGSFIALVIRYGVIVFVLIAVLQTFGIQTTGLVAVLGAGALALGLALQGTLGNVASGIIVVITRPYRIGEHVEINGREGVVADIDLFFTHVKAFDGRRLSVPNGQALSNPVINHTRREAARCDIVFGVGYEDDLDHVMAILNRVMAGDPRALPDRPPWFGVTGLGDYAVEVTARVWVPVDKLMNYRAEMLKAVKEAFDREGIDIPYPHAVELIKGEIPAKTPPIKPPLRPAA